MRLRRRYPVAFACLAFGLSIYVYAEYVFMFGFWDGYASELAYAQKALATWFGWFSVAMALWFFYVAIIARRPEAGNRFRYGSVVYLTIVVVSLVIDQYFRAHLMDSAGG
jgi:uncharacterized membrane protein